MLRLESTMFSGVKPLPSIEESFSGGNYSLVAMQGDPNAWQTYAALGLVGKADEALAGLRHFNHQEAKFYEGVTYWIAGDDDMALQCLEKNSLPCSQNLVELIRKPIIQVLAQLPWSRNGSQNLLAGVESDKKFSVRNISFDERDLQNEPYTNIWKFADPTCLPDFYFCHMVEWHLIPPNLQELPCPILGQTSDYDVHIQATYPWLQLFDGIIVTDNSEWNDLRRLVKVPVVSFPKTFGVPLDTPNEAASNRKIDVFFSGTLFHPYHPDKAKLFHEVIRMPDLQMRFYNGFLDAQSYHMLLGHSKVCFTHCRHTGGTVTRALEALSMGCAVVMQQDCVLRLYFGEEDGVVAYGRRKGDLERGIRQVLEDWPRYAQYTLQGARRVREEFDLSRVASQYLRFLTVLASRPRSAREKVPMPNLWQKKVVLWKGCTLRAENVRQDLLQKNISIFDAKNGDRWNSSHACIDMARELVLAYADRIRQGVISSGADSLFVKALSLYRLGISRFPRSLVLRFNFVRAALHFGSPSTVSEALNLATDTIAKPLPTWELDELEDVFPWDFFETFFNYRRYFEQSMRQIQGESRASRLLVNLIVASIHYYLTYYSDRSFEHAQQACSLDSEFPFYQFRYALELLDRNTEADNTEAEKRMMTLVRESMLWKEVCEVIADKRSSQTAGWKGFSDLNEVFYLIENKVQLLETWRVLPQLRPALNKELVLQGTSEMDAFPMPTFSGLTESGKIWDEMKASSL